MFILVDPEIATNLSFQYKENSYHIQWKAKTTGKCTSKYKLEIFNGARHVTETYYNIPNNTKFVIKNMTYGENFMSFDIYANVILIDVRGIRLLGNHQIYSNRSTYAEVLIVNRDGFQGMSIKVHTYERIDK